LHERKWLAVETSPVDLSATRPSRQVFRRAAVVSAEADIVATRPVKRIYSLADFALT
jgi:hypothetical protein